MAIEESEVIMILENQLPILAFLLYSGILVDLKEIGTRIMDRRKPAFYSVMVEIIEGKDIKPKIPAKSSIYCTMEYYHGDGSTESGYIKETMRSINTSNPQWNSIIVISFPSKIEKILCTTMV